MNTTASRVTAEKGISGGYQGSCPLEIVDPGASVGQVFRVEVGHGVLEMRITGFRRSLVSAAVEHYQGGVWGTKKVESDPYPPFDPEVALNRRDFCEFLDLFTSVELTGDDPAAQRERAWRGLDAPISSRATEPI